MRLPDICSGLNIFGINWKHIAYNISTEADLTKETERPIIKKLRRAKVNIAGWSSLEARRAHNPKVTGSNPVSATNDSHSL